MNREKIIVEILSMGRSEQPSQLISELVDLKLSFEMAKSLAPGSISPKERQITEAKIEELSAMVDLLFRKDALEFLTKRNEARQKLWDLQCKEW